MKWVRHKSKKASHILKESFPGEWEQSICGCFFYADMLVEDNKASKCQRCLKCLKSKRLEVS